MVIYFGINSPNTTHICSFISCIFVTRIFVFLLGTIDFDGLTSRIIIFIFLLLSKLFERCVRNLRELFGIAWYGTVSALIRQIIRITASTIFPLLNDFEDAGCYFFVSHTIHIEVRTFFFIVDIAHFDIFVKRLLSGSTLCKLFFLQILLLIVSEFHSFEQID